MPSLVCIRPFSAQKGNFFGPAAKEGIAIVFPDTSPRGAGIEGEDDDYDFGTGATHARCSDVTYAYRYHFTPTPFHRCWLLLRRHQSKVCPPLQYAHAYPV